MRSIRSLTMTALGMCSALAACEPSLMGDWNQRSPQQSGQSSGNNTWNSPRWASNNPQPPQTPAQTPPTRPQTNTAGSVQQAAPWGGGAQNPANPAAGQGANPAVTQANAQPQVINGGPAPVCEDTQPRALAMPGESCARPCRATWQRCFDGCSAGQDRACVAQCDDTFRECMRGCY